MSNIQNKRIVLIGGAGFIGHHLAVKFKNLGAKVIVIDSLNINNYYHFKDNEGRMPNAKLYLDMIHQRLDILKENNIRLIEQDARDYIKMNDIISNGIEADTLIHLAAVAHADRSNKDPYSTFDHSLRTLENSLDIARSAELNIKHFVYFSSSMIYGHFPSGFVTEKTPCEPLGIYGALKFAGEKMVIAYNQVFNLPYTIVRPSALYGARCVSRRVGQIFIENALEGKEVIINGDGSDRLDFTYIEDLAEGIVKILTNENSKNQIFNMTYGESSSIAEMAEILTDYFPGIKVKYVPKDKLTPDRGTLCVDKARKILGYDPQYPLKKGFAEYINWYKAMMRSSLKRRAPAYVK